MARDQSEEYSKTTEQGNNESTGQQYGKEFYQDIGQEGAEAQPRQAKLEDGKHSHENDM